MNLDSKTRPAVEIPNMKIGSGDLILLYLDSNIILENPSLSNQNWSALKSFVENHSNTLIVVSEVVLGEVKPKIKDQGEQRIKLYRKAIGECLNFGMAFPERKGSEQLKNELEQFSENYLEYLKTSCNGKFALQKLSNIKTKELLQRALEGKKPFNNNGTDGFKDFLIWKGFLEIATKHPRGHFVFVSSNTSDFSGESETELHSDLLGDMASFKGKMRTFYYRKDLSFISSLLPEVNKNKEAITKVVSKLLESCTEAIVFQGLEPALDKSLPYTNSDELHISGYEVSSPEIQSIKRLSSKKILVQGQATAPLEITYYVDKSDVYEAELAGAHINDYDHNDYVSECYVTPSQDFEFALELVENKGEYSLEKIFVNGDEVYPYDKPTWHYL